MLNIHVSYQGDLHCKAVHVPSGTELDAGAHVDNQGRGESFRYTELAAALGTCVLAVVGRPPAPISGIYDGPITD